MPPIPPVTPPPTAQFPENTSNTIANTALSVENPRISEGYNNSEPWYQLIPLCGFGGGANPTVWPNTQQHQLSDSGANVGVNGDGGTQTSRWTWSGTVVECVVTVTTVSNKTRITVSYQKISGGDLTPTWTGMLIKLHRPTWKGWSWATTGVAASGTLPIKPTASSPSLLTSGALTALALTNSAATVKKFTTTIVSGASNCFFYDYGRNTDDPVTINQFDRGYLLYVGSTGVTITTTPSTIVIDLNIPNGGNQDADSINSGGSRTVPTAAQGGQFTDLTWSKTVTAGSIRDWTTTQTARAGDLGYITRDGDDLRYGGKKIRLFGVNLTYAPLTDLTTGQIDTQVAEWAAMGMGLTWVTDPIDVDGGYYLAGVLRVHHSDSTQCLNSGGQHTVNTTKLGKLHYLIDKCARAGIFTELELNSAYGNSDTESNATKANSILPGATTISGYKQLVLFGCEGARADLATYTLAWLTVLNPYSGKPLAQDPCILEISYVNEEIPSGGAAGSTAEKAFTNAIFQAIDSNDFDITRQAHIDYLRDTVLPDYLAWCDALMVTIGYRGLTSAMNAFSRYTEFQGVRSGTNRPKHVDSAHHYWNEPFQSSPDVAHNQPPCVRVLDSLDNPLYGTSRTEYWKSGNNSLIVNEYNNDHPWIGVGEEDAVMACFGASDNFGALVKFAWSDSVAGITGIGAPAKYRLNTTPTRQLSMYILRNVFARRDVAVRNGKRPIEDSDGWIQFRDWAVNKWGQNLRIDTPKSKYFVGNAGDSVTLSGTLIELNYGDRQAVYITSKDDDKTIEGAERLLILHLTKVVAAGTVYPSPTQKGVTTYGTGTLRVPQAQARIVLSVSRPSIATVYPINADMTRGTALARRLTNGKLEIYLDNTSNPYMVYEVDIQPVNDSPLPLGGLYSGS